MQEARGFLLALPSCMSECNASGRPAFPTPHFALLRRAQAGAVVGRYRPSSFLPALGPP